MVATSDPAKYLAADVIFYALVDLIRQRTQTVITSTDFDGAAEFFRSGDYIPWCHMADIDPDAVLTHALSLAHKYRLWAEHPTLYERPHINIPMETWRRPPDDN